MRRGLAAVVLAAVALVAAPAQAGTDQNPPIRTEWMPCSNDEPPATGSCVWDAQHQGNGQGQSLYIGREGKVWPLPHHIAHYLINGNNARGEYFACETPVSSDPTSCIWEETVWLGRSGNDTVIPHSVARYLLSR